MIKSISLYNVCREAYVRNNMLHVIMFLLTYSSLQMSERLVPAIMQGTDVAPELPASTPSISVSNFA